jgi:hypothetical protein
MRKLLLLGASALLFASLVIDKASAQERVGDGWRAGPRDWPGRPAVWRGSGWAGRRVVWGGGSRQGYGWGWGWGWPVPGSIGIAPATTYYKGY